MSELADLLHAAWCCDGITDDGGACKTNRNCELVATRLIAAGVTLDAARSTDGLREVVLRDLVIETRRGAVLPQRQRGADGDESGSAQAPPRRPWYSERRAPMSETPQPRRAARGGWRRPS